MDVREKDEIKGMLLDRWIEDLRQDKAPQPVADTELLTPDEIEEVMHLARWYKAMFYPSEPRIDVDRLASRLRTAAIQERWDEDRRINELIETSPTFGALVRAVREGRRIDPRELERAIAAPEGTIRRLEMGNLPPCRVQLETMVPFLRALRLASLRVVGLIRQTSTEWARRTFQQPQTQLGRTDPQLTDEARRHLLGDEDTSESEAELARELVEIDLYCAALRERLD